MCGGGCSTMRCPCAALARRRSTLAEDAALLLREVARWLRITAATLLRAMGAASRNRCAMWLAADARRWHDDAPLSMRCASHVDARWRVIAPRLVAAVRNFRDGAAAGRPPLRRCRDDWSEFF
ncbi:auxilin-like protein 1 [Dorcoceras hygrometricum]|uniref:Auxilin-like protein 1 n=1 Tax=Dorcoceras hygrometricum TaxID=472368 RepID=A0A2Z6ZUD8_9LAMI|nr:auxilin-like protein 1 [Dorcoceras hygrometricum]